MRRTVLVPRAPKASGYHVHRHGWLYGSGTEERVPVSGACRWTERLLRPL